MWVSGEPVCVTRTCFGVGQTEPLRFLLVTLPSRCYSYFRGKKVSWGSETCFGSYGCKWWWWKESNLGPPGSRAHTSCTCIPKPTSARFPSLHRFSHPRIVIPFAGWTLSHVWFWVGFGMWEVSGSKRQLIFPLSIFLSCLLRLALKFLSVVSNWVSWDCKVSVCLWVKKCHETDYNSEC